MSRAPPFNKYAHPAYDNQKPQNTSLHAPILIGNNCGMNSKNRFTTFASNKIYLHKPKISSLHPSITVEAISHPYQTMDHDTPPSKLSLTNKHNSGGNNFYLAIYHTPGTATSKPFLQKQTAITSLQRSSN